MRVREIYALTSNDIKVDTNIEVDGAPWRVFEFLHVKPGKEATFVRTKMRTYVTGNTVEKTFRAGSSAFIQCIRTLSTLALKVVLSYLLDHLLPTNVREFLSIVPIAERFDMDPGVVLDNYNAPDTVYFRQLSFQMWTDQIQETLNSKKRGDTAFLAKDFSTTIDCYTHFIDGGTMVSPTVFSRRSLFYLLNDMPQEALGDAMQAQVVSPEWPTTFYLQVATLFSLGMNNDAQETLKDGTNLEDKKHRN